MPEPSSDPTPSRRWHPAVVVIFSFVLSSIAALIVPRVVPANMTDFVMICIVWIAFYPVARLKRGDPWWAHWFRGAVILTGFWFASHVMR